MRNIMLASASALAAIGLTASAHAASVTFTGTVDGRVGPDVPPPGATAPDPELTGSTFTVVLAFDPFTLLDGDPATNLGNEVFQDPEITSTITFDSGDADPLEFVMGTAFDFPDDAPDALLDELSFDMFSYEGANVGNFTGELGFENGTFEGAFFLGELLSQAALTGSDSALVTAFFDFNIGGYVYKGLVNMNDIIVNPANPIPIPGAGVLMLSGLAAAGVTASRKKKKAAA